MRLQLPTTTLCCIDCIDSKRAIRVLEHCKSIVDFGAVKLLSSIPTDYEHRVRIMPLNSLIAYSIFALTRLHEYIETEKILIVQRDGWVLNPNSWRDEWNIYDYIGPLYVQYDHLGSGGFSFRSKKLMEETARKTPKWDGTQKHADIIQKGLSYYEDGEISLSGKYSNFNIAPKEVACEFAQGGNRNPEYFREFPFGYHRTWQSISFEAGRVDSSDTSKDLQSTYDHIIDAL